MRPSYLVCSLTPWLIWSCMQKVRFNRMEMKIPKKLKEGHILRTHPCFTLVLIVNHLETLSSYWTFALVLVWKNFTVLSLEDSQFSTILQTVIPYLLSKYLVKSKKVIYKSNVLFFAFIAQRNHVSGGALILNPDCDSGYTLLVNFCRRERNTLAKALPAIKSSFLW